MSKTQMKAPAGATSATIEGHEYTIPKSGIIDVISATHVETLVRHGFTSHFVEPADISKQIDDFEEEADLVEFIEERGGEADASMSMKKLRRLAREAAGLGKAS
jgi:hypothetical protein